MAVYRYEQQNYELQEICQTLEEAEISFIPLKGSVLRAYYPQPWLRTSCDIDILITEKDLEKCAELLRQKLGYEIGEKGPHDVSLNAPSGVHLELHYTLIEEDGLGKGEELLSRVWEFSTSAPNKEYHHVLNDDMFYYYHIAHMAKHYLIGGCGLRPFIDLYILNKQNFLDKQTITLLQEGGLWKFAEQATALSEVWFGGGAHTPITAQMENYLLKGGVYGNMQNRVAVQQVKKGGKFRYIFSRIWLPYSILKFQYPVLEKRKWLSPICQVRRWGRLIFCGRAKNGMEELKVSNQVDEQTAQGVTEMLRALDLQA